MLNLSMDWQFLAIHVLSAAVTIFRNTCTTTNHAIVRLGILETNFCSIYHWCFGWLCSCLTVHLLEAMPYWQRSLNGHLHPFSWILFESNPIQCSQLHSQHNLLFVLFYFCKLNGQWLIIWSFGKAFCCIFVLFNLIPEMCYCCWYSIDVCATSSKLRQC